MDPLVTSSLISTGGSLLGGLLGGGSKRPRISEAIKNAIGYKKHNSTSIALLDQLGIREGSQEGQYVSAPQADAIAQHYALTGKMGSAKLNNIHPLTALGIQPSVSGITNSIGSMDDSSSSRWGDALNEAGQGISRAVAAYSSREEREMSKISAKLQLENQELQNARLRSEIALMHSPGSPPGMSLAGSDSDARYPSQSHMPMGYGDTAPLLRVGRDRNGNPIRVYNDDLGDNEVLQAATAFGYSIPDWLHGNITRPAGAWLRDKLTPRYRGKRMFQYN